MKLIEQKIQAANQALDFIQPGMVVGIGTGTTVDLLIDKLPSVRSKIDALIASSERTRLQLIAKNLPVIDFNDIGTLPLYIDGADQCNQLGQLIKGGGGAHTREKILATAAELFVCIVDESKIKSVFGSFPLPVEVLAMARSYVGRALVSLGSQPRYRAGTVTDNGHVILDVQGLNINEPVALEKAINQIPGVIAHGLFATRRADRLIIGTERGINIKAFTP